MSSRESDALVWSAEPGFTLWLTRAREHSGEWRARLSQTLEGVGDVAATPGGVAPGRSRPRG